MNINERKAARILASDTYEESSEKEYELGKVLHAALDDLDAAEAHSTKAVRLLDLWRTILRRAEEHKREGSSFDEFEWLYITADVAEKTDTFLSSTPADSLAWLRATNRIVEHAKKTPPPRMGDGSEYAQWFVELVNHLAVLEEKK